MIIIKIKTPKDYWKILKELIKSPRQKQCKTIIDYYQSNIEYELNNEQILNYLSNEDKERVINDVANLSLKCKESAYDLIEKCYPKFNILQ